MPRSISSNIAQRRIVWLRSSVGLMMLVPLTTVSVVNGQSLTLLGPESNGPALQQREPDTKPPLVATARNALPLYPSPDHQLAQRVPQPTVTEYSLPQEQDSTALSQVIPSPEASPLGLEQLEAMAIGKNPSVQSAMLEVQRIESLRCQAGLKPNPTLGYFGAQIADEGTDQHGLFLQQQFVRGDKLRLNRNVLDQSIMVAQNQLAVAQQKVTTDVQKLYFQTVAAEKKLGLIRDFQVVAERGVTIAQKRLDAAEASRVELLQARTLEAEVAMTLQQTQATLTGAKSQLANLTGLSDRESLDIDTDLPDFPESIDWADRLLQWKSSSPALAMANAQLAQAEAFLQRQQVQAIPNLTAQIGAGFDNSTNSGMLNLQFSAPIPTRNRNQGNIAAARSAFQQAAAEIQRVETQMANALAQLAAEYENQYAAMSNLQNGILPQIQETLDLSEQAYVAGELDFLQVAVIRRNLYEGQVRWIDAQMALSQTLARLDGMMLEGALDPTATLGVQGLRDQSLIGE